MTKITNPTANAFSYYKLDTDSPHVTRCFSHLFSQSHNTLHFRHLPQSILNSSTKPSYLCLQCNITSLDAAFSTENTVIQRSLWGSLSATARVYRFPRRIRHANFKFQISNFEIMPTAALRIKSLAQVQ
jgi:hypothetical protein